ncbi:CHAT domain-containing protein [Spirosoma validum]|uniref:CHAT domain-containing protein n=1 Tax=Spirosoma validum TaxID=2771355 RepID=A0A927B715_9BACT|nr:CHAT domain-containing tetratricopeptide repeat protein [Spirosoma validum]MBD2756904.1 CHAT domain-containing protein [Spirosoma validum]
MNCRNIFWFLLLLPQVGWTQIILADTYRQKAETLYVHKKYEEATRFYEKAFQLVRTSDPIRAANLCVDLSSMDYMKNQNRIAINRCLLGLRYLHAIPTAPDSARFKLFSSLGTFYGALYRNDSAQIYFRKADALLTQHPTIERQIPLYVLFHFNNQGNWFLKTGNYTRSLSYLTKAQEIAAKYGTDDDLTYVESNLAQAYDAMGDFNEALHHRLLAKKLYKGVDIRMYGNLSGIGWTLYKLHQYSKSLAYFTEAEQLLTTLRRGKAVTDYASEQIHLWWMMSACYRATNQLEKTERYLTQAHRLHLKSFGSQGRLMARIFVEKGQLLEIRHELNQALQAYQEAVRAICRNPESCTGQWQNPRADDVSDETTLLLSMWHKAAVLRKLHTLTANLVYQNAAVKSYQACVDLQEHIRHGIDSEQSQLIFAAQHSLVPEAVSTVFEAYQRRRSGALRDTLFRLFEQAQAGSLREALRLSTIKPQTIPTHLLEREQQLKKQIKQARRKSLSDTTATVSLTTAQLQWHQLLDTFKHDYPAYYRLNYRGTSSSSWALQQQIDNETAYISYVRNETSLFILLVTQQAVEIIQQPIDSVRFTKQLAQLKHQLYHDPFLASYEGTGSAADLYALLIGPVRGYLKGKTRLIIARDWSFAFLPFEVLETGRQAHDYLTRHYAIAYAFSAQLFFDRPRTDLSNKPVLTVAPFARMGTVPSTTNRQANFRPLASSEAEARSIGGDVLLGPEATLANFLKADMDRNVIYFATHAETDDADPSNSYVAFYPDDNNKLYTDEIYDLSLSATGLVVLGACETGSGRVIKSEGVLSLARAFAYAGCPSVVTTLWKANDETTAFLTIRLHEYLTQGMAIDRALQQARQDFFESSLFLKYNHPYYWANYTLLGNASPVMAANRRPGLVSGLVISMLLLSMGVFWQRKRITYFVTRRLSGNL